VWEKKPFYCSEPLPNLEGCFTMEDLRSAVDDDFIE
ncbi:unnamed protein product, partial [Discosporangium mesarthrocarpum]